MRQMSDLPTPGAATSPAPHRRGAQADTTAIAPYDGAAVERAVRDLLIAFGEDPDRDGLAETPARMARAYAEIVGGLHEDPGAALEKTFAVSDAGVVVVRDIPFYSLCEHHLLPFYGRAHVAYQPAAGTVTGLSKLARAVDGYARRPQVQERLTNQVATALTDRLGAVGAAVVVEAEHMCMSMRGIRKPGSVTVTTALAGTFATDAQARGEVLAELRR